MHKHKNYYYNRFTALWILSGTTQVRRYQNKNTHLLTLIPTTNHAPSTSSIHHDPQHPPPPSQCTRHKKTQKKLWINTWWNVLKFFNSSFDNTWREWVNLRLTPSVITVSQLKYLLATSLYNSESKWVFLQVCRLSHLSISLSCLCVRKVYCGKTTNWIRMPFGVVSRVSQGRGVLDGSGDCRRRRVSFGGKCGTSYWNQWGLCGVVILCHEGWQRSFSQITLGFLVHTASKLVSDVAGEVHNALCQHQCVGIKDGWIAWRTCGGQTKLTTLTTVYKLWQ